MNKSTFHITLHQQAKQTGSCNKEHTRLVEQELVDPCDVHLAATGRDFPLALKDMDCHPWRRFPTTARHMTI